MPNITDVSPGVVRMMLRYQPDAWDGDRDLPNKDRHAQVKGLGPHQRLGDTFEYTTTFRTNRELVGSERWTHLFQLKATEGDRGAPLVTLTLQKGTSEGVVQIVGAEQRLSGCAPVSLVAGRVAQCANSHPHEFDRRRS